MKPEQLEAMREYVRIQGANGNWNYDAYMHGLYNGMEMMLAVAENREPVFRDAPDVWQSDIMISPEIKKTSEKLDNTFTDDIH